MPDPTPPDSPAPAPARRTWVWVAVLLVIAFALRVALAFHRPADEASLAALPDQVEYLRIAQSFLDGRGFCFYDTGFADTVYAYRMPGYPLLIAACGAKVRVVQVVQALLDVSSALAAFLLVRRFLSSPPSGEAGWGRGASDDDRSQFDARRPHLTSPGGGGIRNAVALLFVAFNPFLAYFSTLLLSETLFTAMLIWGMLWLTSSRRLVTTIGLLTLILSIYVRPGMIALPTLLALAAVLVRPNLPARRHFFRIPAGATAILLTILLLLPWAIRNRQQLGHWVWMTTNDGITLYDGFNPAADGSSNQSSFRSWPELKTMSEVNRSQYLAALAKQYAVEHPRRVLSLTLAKLERFWSPVPLSDEYGQNRSVVLVAAIFTIPLFVLAAAGVWFGTIGRSKKLFLLLPAVYFTVVHAATIGSLRYRVPVDVPMSVLAAVGAAGVWSRRQPTPEGPAPRSVDNE